jgi:hypothetical protein
MNSAARHCKCGKKNRNKREKSMDKNLIDFLEARGLYQRGRQGINFRLRKTIDRNQAA